MKQIEELRNYNLKYCPSINSNKTQKVISKFQDIYLENVLNIFKTEMTFKFGFKYKLALLFAKIRYWSEH